MADPNPTRSRLLPFFALVVTAAAIGLVASLVRSAPAFEATAVWAVASAVAADPVARDDLPAALATDAVLAAALRARGAPADGPSEVAALRARTDVGFAPDAERPTLGVSVRGDTPWDAVRTAEAVARAFEAVEAPRSDARTAAARAYLDARVDELILEIRALQVVGGEAATSRATELIAVRERLASARDDLTAADGTTVAAIARSGAVRWAIRGAVATEAVLGALAGALAGALVGGVALAVGGARRRRRGGAVPDLDGAPPRGPIAVLPVARDDHDRSWLEVVDGLRQYLLARTRGSRRRVFVVCRAPNAPGPGVVATALAEELAWHGARTLLVDGVLAAPSLAQRYRVTNGLEGEANGLPATTLDWLQRPDDPHRVVRVAMAEDRTFDLVPQLEPARPAPGMAPALYAGLAEALRRWSGYDAIVVDAPSLDGGDDGRLLAAFATGVVTEAQHPGYDRRQDRRWAKIVRDTGTDWLGTVLVTSDTPATVRGDAETAIATVRRRAADRPGSA